MLQINKELGLKLILLFAMINSAIFIGFLPSGALRLAIIGLLLSSGLLLVIFFFSMAKESFDTNPYFKLIFILLISWNLFTVFRSFSPNSQTLITLFGHLEMGWAWLTPFAVIFGLNVFNWLMIYSFSARILLVASILGVIAVATGNVLFSFGVLEMMAFLPAMLLVYPQHTKVSQRIIIFSLIMFVLLSIIASQRANFIFIILVLMFYIFELFKRSKTILRKVIISHIIIFASLFLAYQMNGIITSISEDKEASTDTRSFLFEELFGDLTITDQIVGRGSLGTYYSPYFDLLVELGLPGDAADRSVCEVGYLQMILKGGYITIVLYLLFLLPAAYLGIFKSNNIVAKMSGYYILLYVFLWALTYHPTYSAKFLLLWMAAGTAISGTARGISDAYLMSALDQKRQWQ